MATRTKNPDSTRYVIRIDHKATHGYQVRLPVDGKQQTRFFADGVFGGKRAARNAAITFRDKQCKAMKIPLGSRRLIRKSDKRNKTGTVGVNVYWRTSGGFQYKYYVASWTPKVGANPQRKMFSAHRLGDDKAFEMAVKFRQQKEKEILKQSTKGR